MSYCVREINIQDTSYRRTAIYTLGESTEDKEELSNGHTNRLSSTDSTDERGRRRRRRTPAGLRPDRPNIAAVSTETNAAHKDDMQPRSEKPDRIWRKIVRGVASTLLPAGYPETVRPGYERYQILDGVQGLCSYLRGILSTHALLIGFGVGNDKATAIAATLNWVARDGSSLFGSLIFSWWGGEKFGHDMKFWRLFADVVNDIGMTLELLAPLGGGVYFLLLTCLASTCKSLCGVAAASTESTITQHFAIANNLADVNAKETAQENIVTLLGLVFGGILASYLHTSPVAIWSVFIVLTFVHIYANYLAVTALKLRSLNSNRLALIVLGWILDDKDSSLSSSKRLSKALKPENQGKVTKALCDELREIPLNSVEKGSLVGSLRENFRKTLHFAFGKLTVTRPTVYDPDPINDMEPILPGWIWGYKAMLYMKTNKCIYLNVGTSVHEVMDYCRQSHVKAVNGYRLDEGSHEYVVSICEYSSNTFWIGLLLRDGIKRDRLLFPCVHVHVLAMFLHTQAKQVTRTRLEEMNDTSFSIAKGILQQLMDPVLGWNPDHIDIADEGWRVSFS